MELKSNEDLNALLNLLPDNIREALEIEDQQEKLIEVVMDLGRKPAARYPEGEVILGDAEVTQIQIDHVVAGIAKFDDDNRAGIARTLHRISALKNRQNKVVGLTCRVGKVVHGTSDIISDIIEEGKSLLLLGRPGVGKTTMLREVARILAEQKRVIVVDTSNEIGGDGDIPHEAVGRARRMQVATPALQHKIMIEAVENHNPEVIVIDEIGREEEAMAARTINERGVQLIGTAHGNTLDNLLMNPTLSDLVGGIESVTLSDDEARRRGTQKTVLERRSPPTFDVVVEIQDRERVVIHRDVTRAVDGLLYGRPEPVQLRYRDENDKLHVEQKIVTEMPAALSGRRGGNGRGGYNAPGPYDPVQPVRSRNSPARGHVEPGPSLIKRRHNGEMNDGRVPAAEQPRATHQPRSLNIIQIGDGEGGKVVKKLKVHSYGVDRKRINQAARNLKVGIELVDEVQEANVLVTLKSYYRRRRRQISDAEANGIPIYVLRANSINQIENFLIEALGLEVPIPDPFETALVEVQDALRRVQLGEKSVDLKPTSRDIRRFQHDLIRGEELISHSLGPEPARYVRVYGPNA
ncbi:MAG: stage III sporulation protein SpoIIIAA [Cellvibrionaceae bacterium]|jgi:stage III sporulation protein SpoIIIAA